LWGTSVGGKETLQSYGILPEKHGSTGGRTGNGRGKLSFEEGVTEVNGEF